MEQQNQQPSNFLSNHKLPLIIAAVVIILAVAGILLFAYLNKLPRVNPIVSAQCSQLAQEIDTLIKQANYCEVDEDCAWRGGYPQCDCGRPINKDTYSVTIEDKVAKWQEQCIDSQMLCETCETRIRPPACQSNQCVEVVRAQVLIKNAINFHNWGVVTEGVYRFGFEDSNFDETGDSGEYNIWIEITPDTKFENRPADFYGVEKSARSRTANVRIYGTFYASNDNVPSEQAATSGNFGHLGVWKHQIVADKIVFEPDKPVKDTFSARIVGSYASPGESSKVAVYGNTAYLTDISQGLLAIDVSDPTKPKLLDSYKIGGGGAYAVSGSGATFQPHILVGGYGNSKIVALETKYEGGRLRLEPFKESNAKRSVQEIEPFIDYVYFLAIDGPEFEMYGALSGESEIISGTPGGHILEFAFSFGDAPQYRKVLMAAQGEKGLAVFEMTGKVGEERPVLTAALDLEDYTFAVAADIRLDNLAYALSGKELVVVDMKDAKNPKQRGNISLKGDSADLDVVNKLAAVAIWMEGVEFIDVSDPDNPQSLGVVDTPGRARDVELVYDTKKGVYYAYVADDRDDLQIIEVRR